MASTLSSYDQLEERLNIWTHGLGIPAGIVGLILLLLKCSDQQDYISSLVFGTCMITLYTASTCYHSATNPSQRGKLRVFDHAAIYLQIAGTYTPFALITLAGDIGNMILITVWSFAIIGILLKLFFTGKFKLISTILYVLMGWIGIFAIKPIMGALVEEGLLLVLAGGISYTVGAILYAIKSIPYNHAIFHVFVLIGSLLHFLSIYWYVIG